MRKKLRRTYLYLGNNDYGRVEAELNMYVTCFLFGLDLRANQISYLEWDIYVLLLTEKNERNIWDSYHMLKCADYFPNRLFLVIDKFTWSFFESHRPNMVLMDQPNWPNIVNNHLETR